MQPLGVGRSGRIPNSSTTTRLRTAGTLRIGNSHNFSRTFGADYGRGGYDFLARQGSRDSAKRGRRETKTGVKIHVRFPSIRYSCDAGIRPARGNLGAAVVCPAGPGASSQIQRAIFPVAGGKPGSADGLP